MKKRITLISVIIALVFILLFLDKIVSFAINVQWFNEVNYLSTYFTKLLAIAKLMIPLFLITFAVIWIYSRSIKNSVTKYKQTDAESGNKSKLGRKLFFIIDAVISFGISYAFSSSYWYTILQFANSVSFNTKDPVFHKDVSFYVFKLPLIQSLYNIIMTLLIFLVIITFITYFVLVSKDKIKSGFAGSFEKISLTNNGLTKFAGKQLAIVSSLILLNLSLGYLLKSYNLVYSTRGVAYGASYTDIHVSLLFYRIIIVISLISAIVIFWSVMHSKVKPIVFSIILIFILIASENIVSTLVQKFVVKPNEKMLEQPYIKNNIDYTKKAFNLDKVEVKDFKVNDNLTKDDITNNKDTIDNIRINSLNPSLEFYNQVQIIRYYYGFNDIDIDRYNINGKYNQVFVAARELNTDSLEPNTWQNKHIIYTHGYGMVMSKVNSVTSEGQPDFVIKDIPPENSTGIKLTNPRIYYGEKTNDYAIVDTKMSEFDYPKGGDNSNNNYNGNGGIKMNAINKLLFSINQRDVNFMLSTDITNNSKILINRNIVERARKIAPFLTYDSDPYIVVNGGRLYWIIDAYTTSNRYPFSEPQDNVNYMRNSVKVIVDAVDGSINYYIVDKTDPIIMSYSKIFPDLFKNISELPSGFKEHLKYPEDMFNTQCSVMGKYHVDDPGVFFNGEDLWEVSKDQKQIDGEKDVNEAPYVIMKLPGEKNEEMVVLKYFNMRNKDNMVGLFAARMDNGNYGKMVLYKFPPQKTVYSPYLFKQKLNQDTTISKELSLWNKDGSKVQFGDTIIVPIRDSLLYVEPVYLRASGKNSIPEMKKIIVSYGDKTILSDSVEGALQQFFNMPADNSSPQAVDNSKNNPNTDKIKAAKDLYDKAIEAQKNGDWAKYGEYIKQLGEQLSSVK
ncbi:UPF0182 family protein [Clostridium sp. JN-9]|uniref:UPF0182 family protein n=1 Tax=Clostridium sp. JN-9 TaxID=2507159 RepID=UPI000FFDFF9B|nr:UPF0182 family protein [Clostridium sp. JN-9]QAT38803.1 UPF0182 family protein [Clostridium sp. JN-9]